MTSVAQRAFDWIGSVAVEVEGGLAWLENDDLYDDVYSGTAGVLLGCAEAAPYGLDVTEIARGAAARLLYLSEGDPSALPDDGLFSGWAGVAAALRIWSECSGDVAAAEGAAAVREQISRRVTGASEGAAWCTDVISGDAGVLLELSIDQGAAASILANRLVQRAEPALDGLQWRMAADTEKLMPGFSHGTAGVAYALAVAGRRLHRPDLLGVAAQGARALLTAAATPAGWVLTATIPPALSGPAVNYGWCHGPTGTLRLFEALPPEPQWGTAVDACLQALRDSGLPVRIEPGFWDNLGRCCGTAGVGQVLLDRFALTGDRDALVWSTELADDVLSRTITTRKGATWSNTEHTLSAPELAPQPGFMQGAAGIAPWLARLDFLRAGNPPEQRAVAWV